MLRAQNLADASQTDVLVGCAAEADDVLDRRADVRFLFRGEKHAPRADIPGYAGQGYTFGSAPCYGERELESEPAGPSLFHFTYSKFFVT